MPMAEINVTPMVDVMLVLLIIFMVTANLLTSGVPVNLPDSRAKALTQEREPVQVTVNAGGDVYIDDKAVGLDGLAAALADIAAKQDPENPRQIYLRGDTNLAYGKVMAVMGELNQAGLNKIALVTTTAAEAE
jgi:biopolymer transport protein TolR